MFGWLKRSTEREDRLKRLTEQWIHPQALLGAIIQSIGAHQADIKAGRVKEPAHTDRDAGVLGMWRGVRLEALQRMFRFGSSDITLLTVQPQQLKLADCFLVGQAHLVFPQPSGDVLAQTIQAMWQVYVYLSEVGTLLGDRETDRLKLGIEKTDILANFTQAIKDAQQAWLRYEVVLQTDTGVLPEMPPTLVELLFEDVSAKSKSIALSAMFGPGYEQNIKHFRERLASNPTAALKFDMQIAAIMKATDPDKVAI